MEGNASPDLFGSLKLVFQSRWEPGSVGSTAGLLPRRLVVALPQNDKSIQLKIYLPTAFKRCTLDLSRQSGSFLVLPFGATRALRSPGAAFDKNDDYWTKIKHLPANLWTGSQTTERTAILRSLFSCLLLWFAGRASCASFPQIHGAWIQ